MSAGLLPRQSASAASRTALLLAGGGVVAVLAATVAIKAPVANPVKVYAGIGLVVVGSLCVASPRTERTLAVLMLYLGLADGYLKLKTNSSLETLGRDVLMYGVAVGMLGRAWLRRESMRLPPMSAWVLMWVVLVLLQLFNPHNRSVVHSLEALRPHLEFVPLFFIGYTVMRSRARLRGFCILLLIVANGNAIAGVAQFGDSPAQLAAWGPGYAARVYGTGDVSNRTFRDSAGQVLVRPFGLGDDFGFGGHTGEIALPALVVLLMLSTDRRSRLFALCLAPGVFLAIITSDARVVVVSAFIALVVTAILMTTRRNFGRVLLGLLLTAVLGGAAISIFASANSSAEFSRYSSIAPTKAGSTAYQYRKGNLAQIPTDVARFPFGTGLGSAGPGADGAGAAPVSHVDAEGEALFLLVEVGVPGALVLLGFNVRLMILGLTRLRRVKDDELRTLLIAFAAPMFSLFAGGFAGINSTGTPSTPLFWFSAGVLSYWLFTPAAREERPPAPAEPRVTSSPRVAVVAP